MICDICKNEETLWCWDLAKGVGVANFVPDDLDDEAGLIYVCDKCWAAFRAGSWQAFRNLLIFAFRQIAKLPFLPAGDGKSKDGK